MQSLFVSASLHNSNDSDSPCCALVKLSNGTSSASSSLLVLAFLDLGLMPAEAAATLGVGSCKEEQIVSCCQYL